MNDANFCGPAHRAGIPEGVSESVQDLHRRVAAALRQCYDPEIPVDIYELGLIYDIQIDDEGNCEMQMTLTSPACPVAGTLPPEVEERVRRVEGIQSASVEVVWDPTWSPEMMTEAARLELGMY